MVDSSESEVGPLTLEERFKITQLKQSDFFCTGFLLVTVKILSFSYGGLSTNPEEVLPHSWSLLATLLQAVNAVSGVRLARKQETYFSSAVFILLIGEENENFHAIFFVCDGDMRDLCSTANKPRDRTVARVMCPLSPASLGNDSLYPKKLCQHNGDSMNLFL